MSYSIDGSYTPDLIEGFSTTSNTTCNTQEDCKDAD